MPARVLCMVVVFSTGWALCPAANAQAAGIAEQPAGTTALDTEDVRAIQTVVQEEFERLLDLYKHLHQNPERSLHEVKTSARLGAILKDEGYEVTAGVGGHGVVALLRNGDGPTIMYRADMDALPITEKTGLPYASTVTVKDNAGKDVGVMHACGHDVHMTCLIGVSRVLARTKERWSGTLMLVCQPAEEHGGGAKRMLEDGLFTRFPKPDQALALHVSGSHEAGTVVVVAGYALANVDSMDVTIRGRGGHGASPHRTIDPILLASRTVVALQGIVAREVNPIDSAVVTVGSIHGGTQHNIIPDEVKLQLTIRSYKDDIRRQLRTAIERIVRGEAQSAGAPEPSIVTREGTPSTYNDPALVARTVPAFERALGKDRVQPGEPVMGGEDFALYGRAGVPAFIFWLGGADPEKLARSREPGGEPLPSLHSPLYYPPPEPTIKTGVVAASAAILNLLGRR